MQSLPDIGDVLPVFYLHEGTAMSPRLLSLIRAGRILLALALFAGLISTAAAFINGQAASLVLGQSDFTSNAHPTTASAMASPEDVAAEPPSRKQFVADSANNRGLAFDSGTT